MSHIKVKIKSKRGFGNSKSKSERKTRRSFYANRQKFTFMSNILGSKVSLYCPCRELRSIMNYGGNIDYYIMNAKYLPKEFSYLKKALFKKNKVLS